MPVGSPQLLDTLDPFAGIAGGGSGITALTGDATATGPGSAAITLALTGAAAGTYHGRPIVQVDTKGRVLLIANDVVDVRDYGALLDGTTDDTAAIQAAVDVSGPHIVYIPKGTSKIVGTVTIAQDGVQIIGAGVRSTAILFAPTSSPQSCFVIHNGGNPVWNTRISGMTFTSADTTRQKTMIDVIDARICEIDHILAADTTWTGATSRGLRIRGHEFVHVHDCTISTDNPISIGQNPNATSYDCDHGHFHDLCLLANGAPVYNIESGTCLTNVTLDGAQAWVRGTYGFYVSGFSAVTAPYQLKISNVRQEQMSANNHFIHIDAGAGYALYQLILDNITGPGATGKGIYLRGVKEVSLSNFRNMSCTGEILNIDATVYEFDWKNCDWGASPASVSTTGQSITYQWNLASYDASQALAPSGHMSLTSVGVYDFIQFGGLYHFGRTNTLTAGANVILPINSATGQGHVELVFTGLGGEGCGSFGVGLLNTYKIGGTANCDVGNVGAKVCCFYSSPASIMIINNLANTIKYTVVGDWSP